MMLYNAHNDYSPYNGEVVNNIRLPGNVEQVWEEEKLISVGLWPHSRIAPADPVPDGKIIVSTHIEEIEGIPTFVNELADAPEPEPEPLANLKPYQFWTVMRATGHEDDLRNWVSSLNDEQNPNYDPVAWAYASSVIDYSLEYRRDHPLVESARQVMGVTVSELDDLWAYAATL